MLFSRSADTRWFAVRSAGGGTVRRDAWRLAATVLRPGRDAVVVLERSGKPVFDRPGPQFSIAHHVGPRSRRGPGAPAVAVVAMSTRPVGVDVLCAARFSGPVRDRLAALAGLNPELVQRLSDPACSRLWCRVEALVKLDGGSLLAEVAAGAPDAILVRERSTTVRTTVWTGQVGGSTVVAAVSGRDVPDGPPVWLCERDLPETLPSWAARAVARS